jgi:NAD(P)-dependent dehydrogenase (short-subunit alcohol dehydrogenase family)
VLSAIVFGGSRGIGKIISEYLASKGYRVTISGRDRRVLNTVRQDALKQKLRINIVKADITDEREVNKVFESHNSRWHKYPNIVINCAAVQGPIGDSWSVPIKDWNETVKINLLGSYIVARTAAKLMIKRGRGSIILFSGGGAAYGRPKFGAYGVSKTGVLRLVETMAEELKLAGYPRVIINAVAPGAIKTRMTDEVLKANRRAGEKALEEAIQVSKTGGTSPKEITDLIDFLIDAKVNRGLTGRLIHVREDYRSLVNKFGNKIPDEIGKIRRIPIK